MEMVGYYCIQSFSCSLVFYYHILFGNQSGSNILLNYLGLLKISLHIHLSIYIYRYIYTIYQTTLPASWEICMTVKKQQLEPNMEQQTGCRLGKEYVKAVCYHPAYLIYMQSTTCEMLGWMKHKLGQDCWEKYQQLQICRWHHPYSRKRRGTEEPLDESERGEWKSWLKTQHSND